MPGPNLKLIAFDMDGTLTTERSSWQYLHSRMGVWEETAHVFQDRFCAGEINYEEFCRLDASLWRGLDSTKARQILSEIKLRPGARRVLAHLHASGIKTVLLSSGLKLLADQLVEVLPFHRYLANELVTRDGRFTGEVIINVSTDVLGLRKEDYFKKMMQEYRTRPKETAAVGDSPGDLEMFRLAGKALLIGARPEEQEKIQREVPGIKLLAKLEDIFKYLA